MYRTNYVEIEPRCLEGNARGLRQGLRPGTRLMAVVKADGYGHGAVTAARAALRGGAEWLGVALPEEGEALRAAGITAPILVLGLAEPVGAEASVRLDLAQTVCDADGLRALSKAAAAQGKQAAVHLKLDTGMGRIGVRDAGQAKALLDLLYEYRKNLRLEGIFTHFACADDPDPAYTRMQQQRFGEMLDKLPHKGALVHAANSAATLRFPETHYDLVRCGIALYGAPPVAPESFMAEVAMRWVTRAALIKELPPGEAVSYGATFTAERPTRVMTLPVGYADGYRRELGGRAQVLVHGRRAPVIGRVCMDQCLVDVTDIPQAAEGDEVVLLGKQHASGRTGIIAAAELAEWMGTIAYEAFLAPSARVPRRIVGQT